MSNKFEKDSLEELKNQQMPDSLRKALARNKGSKMDFMEGMIATAYFRPMPYNDNGFEGATDDNHRFKFTEKAKNIKVGDTLWYHSLPVLVLEVKEEGCEFGYFKESVGFYRSFDSVDFPKFTEK